MVYSVKIFGVTVEYTRRFKEAETAWRESGAREKAIWQIAPNGAAKRVR